MATTLNFFTESHISDHTTENNMRPTAVSGVEMANATLDSYSNTTMNTTLDESTEGNIDTVAEYSNLQLRAACDLANAGILALVMPFILAGNLLVVIAVIKFRKLRTSLNMFVASLAVSDMLVGFPTIPVYVIYYSIGDVLKNFKYLCLFRYLLVVLSMSGSIISLTFMSFDRYVAIVHPLHYPTMMTKRRVRFLLLGMWTYGVVFSILPSAGVNVWQRGMACEFFHVLPKWYTFFTVPFIMATCLFLSLVTYVVVFRVAKKHQARMKRLNVNSARKQENNPRQMQKDTRNAKVMAFVLLLFVIFWFPFLATSLLKFLPFSQDVFEIAKNFALTLAMTNSMCNPVVYCWLKEDFRRAFKMLLCCRGEQQHGRNQSTSKPRPHTSQSSICSSSVSTVSSIETTCQ